MGRAPTPDEIDETRRAAWRDARAHYRHIEREEVAPVNDDINDGDDLDTIRTLIGRLFQNQPWLEHAACAGEATRVFFPERGELTTTAKSYCQRCPVQQECLDYALEGEEKHGIWGGTSERQRRTMRKIRRDVA